MRVASGVSACDACLRRAWLIATLAPNVDVARRSRKPLRELLALADLALIEGLAGGRRGEVLHAYEAMDADDAREACERAALTPVCRHDERYPARLADLADAPAVLHVAGDPARLSAYAGGAAGGEGSVPAVAVVGARRASATGLEVAQALGRGLAAAGVTVVSGLALGVDAAAHAGALAAEGPTLAVLGGGADVPYPQRSRHLYRELVERHCVVSEMPPGFRAFKWSFPGRNRIIAALARLTVVVEAAERSGSLITADFAAQMGREVAAVPGSVVAHHAAGSNALLRDGASVVRHAQDVLDEVLGIGHVRSAPVRDGSELRASLRDVLRAVERGRDTAGSLIGAGGDPSEIALALAELELLGYVRRDPAGRYLRRAA
jgi:DNA processing protein